MSFDKWFDENYPSLNVSRIEAQFIFNSSADIQQSKIDSLHKNIEALHVENERIQKQYSMMFDGVQGRQKTIDELQKRIGELEKELKSADDAMRSSSNYKISWNKG